MLLHCKICCIPTRATRKFSSYWVFVATAATNIMWLLFFLFFVFLLLLSLLLLFWYKRNEIENGNIMRTAIEPKNRKLKLKKQRQHEKILKKSLNESKIAKETRKKYIDIPYFVYLVQVNRKTYWKPYSKVVFTSSCNSFSCFFVMSFVKNYRFLSNPFAYGKKFSAG